jgi:hypothetical protein
MRAGEDRCEGREPVDPPAGMGVRGGVDRLLGVGARRSRGTEGAERVGLAGMSLDPSFHLRP